MGGPGPGPGPAAEEARGAQGRVAQPYLLLDHRAGRVVALVVGAGALLLLYHVPVGVVVPRGAQRRELLLDGVRGKLLDCEPVQALLPEGKGAQLQAPGMRQDPRMATCVLLLRRPHPHCGLIST